MGGAFTNAPASDDANWLAQQPSQIPFGLSDNFAFGQQQHSSEGAAGASILNQTDNSLLGDFFNNPEITSQMDFNFSTMTGDEDGEESKPNTAEGLFDLHEQSATINPASTALSPQQFGFGGYSTHTPRRSISNSQQPGVNGQMTGMHNDHGDHQEVAEDGENEEEETKAVAQGLIGMSNNRPSPAQMIFSNGNGFNGSTWGNMHPLPSPAAQYPYSTGRQSAGPSAQGMLGLSQGQGIQGPFGYYTPANLSQHHMRESSIDIHMFQQQQAYANQMRSRHRSMGNIQTAGFTHFPQHGPLSALLPGSTNADFNNTRENPRSALRTLRYGSDDNFGSSSYRPPSDYNPEDEKAANLTGVPLAREASVNSQLRQSPMMPPHARTHQAGAQNAQSQGYNSSNSQPSTPTFYNSQQQHYLGGLPGTHNNTSMMGNPTYGGSGMSSYSHAHPPPHPNYHQHMQFNRAALNTNHRQGQDQGQGHHVEPTEVESSSSDSEETGADSPALAPSQSARKRRKSDYEQVGEDDYRPSNGGKRHVNSSALDGSDDEYGRPDSSTGNKRARSSTAYPSNSRRKSIATSASTPDSQAARTPRPSTGAPGKRSSRKRQSGTHIPRAPLTEEQRRKNHIQSEKNRRDLIKANYNELNNLVPALKNGKSGLSKSEVLKEIVEFIEELVEGNEYMEDVLNSTPGGFQSKYDDGFASSDEESNGPGGAAGGSNGIGAY